MAVHKIITPQAGKTVIVRNRPALVRSVDERHHHSMPATHEVQPVARCRSASESGLSFW